MYTQAKNIADVGLCLIPVVIRIKEMDSSVCYRLAQKCDLYAQRMKFYCSAEILNLSCVEANVDNLSEGKIEFRSFWTSYIYIEETLSRFRETLVGGY